MGNGSSASSAQAAALKVSLVVSESKKDASVSFYSGRNVGLLQNKSPRYRAGKTLSETTEHVYRTRGRERNIAGVDRSPHRPLFSVGFFLLVLIVRLQDRLRFIAVSKV